VTLAELGGVIPAVVLVPAVVAAAGMRAEDEAGEEDRRDDEHDAGDDADPSQHLVELAGLVFDRGGGHGGDRCYGRERVRRGIRRLERFFRGFVTHVIDDPSVNHCGG